MWAQLISTRVKAGREGDLARLEEQIRKAEQPDSGLVRSLMMQDQKDPSRMHMLVIFESEEKARARENDPRRQEGLQAARELMAEIFDGPPEFADLTVVNEFTPVNEERRSAGALPPRQICSKLRRRSQSVTVRLNEAHS
jgi:hypothetical protein